jgi:hypothetical protein
VSLHLAIDEGFDGDLLRGVRRRLPLLNALRAQDSGLSGADDPTVLAWAAAEGRVLLTQDVATMPNYAAEAIRSGRRMPGMIVVPASMPLGRAIDELELLIEAMPEEELVYRIIYLPLP